LNYLLQLNEEQFLLKITQSPLQGMQRPLRQPNKAVPSAGL